MTEYEVNQRVAERICDGAGFEGRQFHNGDCVALLDGRVVAVAPDLAAALDQLRALDPDPNRGMVFEIRPNTPDVIRPVRPAGPNPAAR